MFIIEVYKKQHISVELEINIDYTEEDMESSFGTALKEIKTESLKRIAKEKGFDGWEFSGHINQIKGTCKTTFYKLIKE